MGKVYIFDVDGTLTPSRLPMTKEFLEFFDSWSKRNPFYLVTGSDINKTKQQVPDFILERTEALFTCCGNEMWIGEEQKYRKEFKPSRKLKKLLGTILSNSSYPHRYGNHIEDRETMLNFSIVGRNCTQEQREEYHKWDKENREREIISNAIKEKFPDLDAVLGGQISIDIYPKGRDKSQVLEHIEKRHETVFDFPKIIFIGDGIENKGNDYALAKLMDSIIDCEWYHTEDWKQTKQILEKLGD